MILNKYKKDLKRNLVVLDRTENGFRAYTKQIHFLRVNLQVYIIIPGVKSKYVT